MEKSLSFVKKNILLIGLAIVAILSCIWILPDAQYFSYFDFRAGAALLGFAPIIWTLGQSGIYDRVGTLVARRIKTLRGFVRAAVWGCFLLSLILPKYVPILLLMPFTLSVLYYSGLSGFGVLSAIQQLIAVHIGGIWGMGGDTAIQTVVKNFAMPLPSVILGTLTIYALGMLVLFLMGFMLPKIKIDGLLEDTAPLDGKKSIAFGMLLVLLALSAVGLLKAWIGVLCAFAYLAWQNRSTIRSADYSLPIAFVFVSVLCGNLSRTILVQELTASFMRTDPILFPALIAQLIGDVRAAHLLGNYGGYSLMILRGIGAGAMGSLLASVANLAAFYTYKQSPARSPWRYIGWWAGFGIPLILLSLLI